MSNIIKPGGYIPLADTKLIEASFLPAAPHGAVVRGQISDEHALAEMESMKEQIIRDAETFAEEQLRQAIAETAAAKERAEAEIAGWWQERRAQDEQALREAAENGYKEGYNHGLGEANAAVRREYAEMLGEATNLLEEAYRLKQQIIQEAEPFLIELSCAIAEKIIHQQLMLAPDWVKDMTSEILSRRREKGIITLCVAPQHFAYFQDARGELALVIDSQAELQILPDATVTDHGCVIRSAFGSIDARVDTQLKEIKNALQQLALRGEEEPGA